nr:MAG TPA: hypothetical protein [Bacteriophage sp.]
MLKRSFSIHTPQYTAEDSTRNTTVPRYRSNAVIWRTAGIDRDGRDRFLDVRRHPGNGASR